MIARSASAAIMAGYYPFPIVTALPARAADLRVPQDQVFVK
jgi:hypothetical protein